MTRKQPWPSRSTTTSTRWTRLIHYDQVDEGGLSAAWDEPELFVAELRAAFRPRRALEPGVK